MAYMLEDSTNTGIGGENTVEESMFEGEEEDIQGDMEITLDMGGVGKDEICETGGVTFDYLKALIDKLKKEIETYNRPKIYQNGSFWHHPRDPIFALEASRITSSGNNPRELYHRDVFVWPLGLHARLPGEPEHLYCPNCQANNRHSHKLKRAGMHYKCQLSVKISEAFSGFNSNPFARRVKNIYKDYFLLTNRLECAKNTGGCGAKFQATDPSILAQLSHTLQEAFPGELG